jgi:uncharacterized protein YdhG (YjbR/CyaY superfamily)
MAKTKQAKKSGGFTAEERAAMRERVKELKAAKNKEEGEKDVLAKIKEMGKSDRAMAQRIHEIVKETAPDLAPRTWYGMPAWSKDDKVVCFYRPAEKFKDRYATFGFNDTANLDEGSMWPTSWGLTKLTAADEKKIARLVKKAVS